MLAVLAVFVGLFWASIAVYAFAASYGSARENITAVDLPFFAEVRPIVRLTLTQGWGFFTKSPRDHEVYIFGKVGDRWTSVFDGPSSKPENLFGLRRTMRAQGLEFGLLISALPSDAWVACEGNMLNCISTLEPHFIDNVSTSPHYCGEIAFGLQEPIPWAWARMKQEFIMPSSVVRTVISC